MFKYFQAKYHCFYMNEVTLRDSEIGELVLPFITFITDCFKER